MASPFQPGSPAGAPSLAGSLIKSMAGGGIPLPNFSSSSSSRSGDAFQGGSTTGDGFNVNFGSGVMQGGSVPSWAWAAAAILAGVWAWKRFS